MPKTAAASIRSVLALSALALGSAAAFAQPPQSGQYRLDEAGQWVPVETAPLSPDGQTMARARALLADNKPGPAERILNEWIEEHQFTRNPYLAEAYLLRGDAVNLRGNEYEALRDYEMVTKDFPASDAYPRAVERELEIGIRYLHGLKRKLWGFRWVDADDIGEELLARVQERMPASRLAERAAVELADYYYRERDLTMASTAYEIITVTFPKSEHIPWARQRRIHSSIGRFKGPAYDATGLRDALILIEDFEDADPVAARAAGLSDALVARIDESLAAQMLQKARWYLRRGDGVSARSTLQRLVRDHPQTVSAGTGIRLLEEHKWPIARTPAQGAEPPASAVEPQPQSQPTPAPPEPQAEPLPTAEPASAPAQEPR